MGPTCSAVAFLLSSGLVAGVGQVLVLRELLVACFGNEVSVGLMLAGWLVCGAVGVLAARRWRPLDQPLERTVRRATKLVLLAVPALALGICFARLYPALACVIPMKLAEVFRGSRPLERLFTVYLACQPGEMLGPLHLGLVTAGAACWPAVVNGALFAVALRAYEQIRQHRPAAIGQAYGLDAIGHLLGGVVLAWAVVMVLNPLIVACAAGALLWCSAFLLARCTHTAPLWSLWGAAIALAGLLTAAPTIHRHTARVRWHGRELLDQVNSRYGHVAVGRQGTEGVVFFENGVPTGLSPALPAVQELVQFAMLQHPAPRRVLLIGGGATGGLVEILKHNPQHVDYVELDPTILRLAAKWVSGPDKRALQDARVTTLVADGRLVVKQAAAGLRERYDVILTMLPDPSTALLNRFYTAGWFREARRALNPGGVLAWQMSSTRHYFRPSLRLMNSSILRALSAAFPRRALMPGDESLIIAAGDEQSHLSEDLGTLRQRMRVRRVDAPLFDSVAPDRLNAYDRSYVLSELAKGEPAPPNEDLAPVGYFYDQASWIGFYYPELEILYIRLSRLELSALWRWFLAAFVILSALALPRRTRGLHLPLAIMVTGALGMALELCLVFAFQTLYGYVYHQVGILIGAFMIGLAGGAMWMATATERVASRRSAVGLLAAMQGAVGLLALALPPLLRWISQGGAGISLCPLTTSLLFPVLMAVAGLGVGVQFPLAARAASRRASPGPSETGMACDTPAEESRMDATGCVALAPAQAPTAAVLYAADLVGAALGAATAGGLFIPILGIPQTCLAAAVLSGGMATLLALSAVPRAS